MSKNKSGSAKSGTRKIPKRIAGVKIPKELRESGNAAVKFAQSPMARDLLSAGLAAAAAAVAANARARKAAGQGSADASAAFAEVADVAAKTAGEIKTALVQAAGVAAQQFFGGGVNTTSNTEPNRADPASVVPETPVPETSAPDAVEASRPRANGARPSRPRAVKPKPAPIAPN